MPEVEGEGEDEVVAPGRRTLGVVLPAVAAGAVYGWAAWSFGSASAPSGAVAVGGAAALLGCALVAYLRLVRGAAGCFGALALGAALLLSVAAADRTAVRDDVVTCVIREVRDEKQKGFGDGDVEITVHHHTLRCPGGAPETLTRRERLGSEGEKVEVALDSARRVAPVVDGESSPWPFAVPAVLLLAAATAGAARPRRLAG
ncbi:hypothetical protein [Streptomyces sp. NPDC048172]|uniref:hypothetical protein n=1 Tax=Streptomyces sp. NPDC048172 TaxID=3365505 RepID=UPI003720CFBF